MRARVVESHRAFVGALVTWMHVPRGGYGFVWPVDAEIVALNLQGTRAKIAVKLRSGARVTRHVDTCNLRWRDGTLGKLLDEQRRPEAEGCGR